MKSLVELMTLENATKWEATDEKWCFCTDLLDAADQNRSDKNVDELEEGFIDILSNLEG